jgi:predicted RNase H-like nuclease (RuvC/YqgF family)
MEKIWKNKDESLEEKTAHIQTLTDSLEERNARIRALEEEIRALRRALSSFRLDTRFWIGFPIGPVDDPHRRRDSERRSKNRPG